MWWIIIGVIVFLVVLGNSGATTRRGNPVYCAKCRSRNLKILSEDDAQITYKCLRCGDVGTYGLRR